jgi:hypothetical protein
MFLPWDQIRGCRILLSPTHYSLITHHLSAMQPRTGTVSDHTKSLGMIGKVCLGRRISFFNNTKGYERSHSQIGTLISSHFLLDEWRVIVMSPDWAIKFAAFTPEPPIFCVENRGAICPWRKKPFSDVAHLPHSSDETLLE